MSDFTPMNPLENALVEARSGRLPMRDLIATLMTQPIAVPSASDMEADGSGFRPLIFSKNEVPMVACFTDKSRIADYAQKAPYCLMITGGDFVRRLPSGHGLVVNPGQSVGFDMPPEGVADMVRDFAGT